MARMRVARRRRHVGVGLLLAVAATAVGGATAPAADAPATATMTMTGDPITGSFSFRQDLLDLQAGDVVRFHNANTATTHTATEVHGLWELVVAPGGDATRALEAGTHVLICRLHPALMHATIRVSPRVEMLRRAPRAGRRRGAGRLAVVTWAPAPAPAGESFDVQRRRGEGPWSDWRAATDEVSGRLRVAPGDGWEVRARARTSAGTGEWSPAAPVVP